MDEFARGRQTTSQARAIYQPPPIIRELENQLQRSSGSSAQSDPVEKILFSFYNAELWRLIS